MKTLTFNRSFVLCTVICFVTVNGTVIFLLQPLQNTVCHQVGLPTSVGLTRQVVRPKATRAQASLHLLLTERGRSQTSMKIASHNTIFIETKGQITSHRGGVHERRRYNRTHGVDAGAARPGFMIVPPALRRYVFSSILIRSSQKHHGHSIHRTTCSGLFFNHQPTGQCINEKCFDNVTSTKCVRNKKFHSTSPRRRWLEVLLRAVQCTKFLQTSGLVDRQCPSKVSMKEESRRAR
jgi:hypothetical protein